MNYDNEEKKTNVAHVAGRVNSEPVKVWEIYGEQFYEFELATKRLSGEEDLLLVTVSERLLNDKELKVDDFVEINGEFRSYNRIVDGKSRLHLNVFAKEIDIKEKESIHENEVSLTGYICKQPIYRETPFGRQITDVLIAVNRPFSTKSDYIPVIAWGRNALFVGNLAVGTKIEFAGRIQSRIYHKKLEDGNSIPMTAYEVSAQKVQMLEKPMSKNTFGTIKNKDIV